MSRLTTWLIETLWITALVLVMTWVFLITWLDERFPLDRPVGKAW